MLIESPEFTAYRIQIIENNDLRSPSGLKAFSNCGRSIVTNEAEAWAAMVSDRRSHVLTMLIAGVATVAVFAKSFTPYYLVGSTPIFAGACLLGIVLTALNWRQVVDLANHVRLFLLTIGLLYAVVIASFFINSFPQVPLTHLLGILIFHAVFLTLGFASARAPNAIFAILLMHGIAYVIIYGQHTIRYGDFVRDGFADDVFGIGRAMALAIHQQVGSQLALAAIVTLGLISSSKRLLAFVFIPVAMYIIYRLQARTAMIAFGGSLAFLALGELSVRRKGLAPLLASTLAIAAVLASVLFFQYALKANIQPDPPDLISRTILEIQQRPAGTRLDIWLRTWDRIVSHPNKLVLGRGVGSFSIDEGVGPPDWLLKKTVGASTYPHNIHLEMLYETGVLGLLVFSVLTLLPLAAAIRYWSRLSVQEKLAVSIYFFYCIGMELSGAFAVSYDFQFFLGLAIGIVGLKQQEIAAAAGFNHRFPVREAPLAPTPIDPRQKASGLNS